MTPETGAEAGSAWKPRCITDGVAGRHMGQDRLPAGGAAGRICGRTSMPHPWWKSLLCVAWTGTDRHWKPAQASSMPWEYRTIPCWF